MKVTAAVDAAQPGVGFGRVVKEENRVPGFAAEGEEQARGQGAVEDQGARDTVLVQLRRREGQTIGRPEHVHRIHLLLGQHVVEKVNGAHLTVKGPRFGERLVGADERVRQYFAWRSDDMTRETNGEVSEWSEGEPHARAMGGEVSEASNQVVERARGSNDGGLYNIS